MFGVPHRRAHLGELHDALQLDLIQLHGDEPPEYLAELGDIPLMRVFRPTAASLADDPQYVEAMERAATAGLAAETLASLVQRLVREFLRRHLRSTCSRQEESAQYLPRNREHTPKERPP